MNTGSVRIKGPMTKEDKVRWDQLRDLKATLKLDIDEMTALLATHPEDRDQIKAEIHHSQRVLTMISAAVGD